MLKTKLFRAFAVLVILFGVLSGAFGVHAIYRRVVAEAQTRASLGLNSAHTVCRLQLDQVHLIARLTAAKSVVTDFLDGHDVDAGDVRARLERVRTSLGLDFLSITDASGKVVLRAASSERIGDYRLTEPVVARALRGEGGAEFALWTREELSREMEGLADKAFIEIEETPRARRSPRREENRGMVMVAASPVLRGAAVRGAVYGGVLLNRNHSLVDSIQTMIFADRTYRDAPVGNVTIFLSDCRVATTVRGANGNRAIGTRVSKEVADNVLDNGREWTGSAFVVRDWYITAYEPIRNGMGEIIGMLYVGILKRPFDDAARRLAGGYLVLSVLALAMALGLALLIAGKLAAPIHRLVEAANRMAKGERPPPVPTCDACLETATLVGAFNQMTETLTEREERLKALNRSYMETLGFVSHELKSPVATIVNYSYLLRERKLGDLNDRQVKAVKAIDAGSLRLVEMVRHYLNLARIENGDLAPARRRLAVVEEVLAPLIETEGALLSEREMTLDNRVPPNLAIEADANMTREVFENLISNAIKYGKPGGRIVLEAAVVEGGFVEFSVGNEGEGIPADRVGQLFQKFTRLENASAVRREKGTGLGLFITKHIVEAHGGRIRVESRPGEWTEFRFTLPAIADPSGVADPAEGKKNGP